MENSIRENLASIKRMNVGEKEKKILGDNAKKLFKIE
jgi:hypothetical protein